MPNGRALLVGINAYADDPLDGSVNDAADMADQVRRHHGFDGGEVKLLLDGDATRDGILAGLRWLLDAANSRNRLLFYYSGHGARRSHGAVAVLDVICPVEFDWKSEANGIDALQLASVFAGLPDGCRFSWVADCCFSGNLALDAARPGRKPKFKAPPAAEAARMADTLDRPDARFHIVESILPFNGGFLSACTGNQEADDDVFDGCPNGAFTYCLLRALRSDPMTPLAELPRVLRRDLRNRGYDQAPQVRGSPAMTKLPFLGRPDANSNPAHLARLAVLGIAAPSAAVEPRTAPRDSHG